MRSPRAAGDCCSVGVARTVLIRLQQCTLHACRRPHCFAWPTSRPHGCRPDHRRDALSRLQLQYTEAKASPEELLEHVLDTKLTDVTRTIVRDGRVVAEIRAQKVLNFRRRARTILLDVQYRECDDAGNAITIGSGERATYYTERKDAELAGSIRLRSDSQQVSLEADTLRWEDGRRRLGTSPPEAVVQILRDDGSQLRGTGLEVDVRRKTIRFTGPVSGTVVTQTDGSHCGERRRSARRRGIRPVR